MHIFQLRSLVLEFFKMFSLRSIEFLTQIRIQYPSLSLIANFHDLSISDFNFVRMTNLKGFYKGFDRE